MWLTLGRDCAGADETWVKPVYDSAFNGASDDERAMALVLVEDWLKGHRDTALAGRGITQADCGDVGTL